MTIENICMQTQKELKKSLYAYLKSMKYLPIKKDGFIFAQGEQPVLLVAHLDTVHKQRVKQICYSKDGNIIMSPEGIGGDDRCGVYMILQIIKKLKCSVLFCEDEEQGAIGAIKFTKSDIVPENINYIIELDRRGANDAVFYDCDNTEFTDFILEAGFVEDIGSFSDISEIAPYLNIAAVNISSGYYNAHTQHEYINMAEVKNNIERVCRLIQKKSTKFDYVESAYFTDEFAGLYNSCYEHYFDSGRKVNRLNRLFSGYKELMPITDELGYVIDESGIMNDPEGFYIDKNNKVYIYDWQNDVVHKANNYQIKNHEGGLVSFNETLAEPMLVMNF